ncbi:hypothetical protein ACFWIO_21680 [Streptomyces diastatochromogenes]|uniref:hypothetical protein n=1 Tax=Streptomyces diastatochromogenes TaxID=42236 RepID=UPI00365D3CF7
MRDIMTDVPTAVDAQASVTSVAQVMDDGDLMGLVGDRDLVIGAVTDGTDPQRMPVARGVQGDLITVDAGEDIDHVNPWVSSASRAPPSRRPGLPRWRRRRISTAAPDTERAGNDRRIPTREDIGKQGHP